MISLITVLLNLTNVHAEVSTSVWEQMQVKNISQVQVVVESLEVSGNDVIVAFKQGDQVQESALCRDPKNEPYFGLAPQNQRVELLREALRSGQKVEIGLKGPWSPCLDSVKLSKLK